MTLDIFYLIISNKHAQFLSSMMHELSMDWAKFKSQLELLVLLMINVVSELLVLTLLLTKET